MAKLEPVLVGGHVVAYRPAETPKTPAKSAAKKQAAASPASTAEEAK